jgi:type II secretory pathway component PulK
MMQTGLPRAVVTRRRRGVALILVLWLVVVLGTIGAGVVAATRGSTALASNARAHVVARYAAESGIALMKDAIDARLASGGDAGDRAQFLNALPTEWDASDSTVLGEGRVAGAVIDASARLDVNVAPVPNLAALLAHFTDAGRALDMARLIRDRVERGAEPGGGGTLLPADVADPYVHPLRSLEELRAVPGLDQPVLQLAAPYLTVDGDGTINRRTASDTVLAAAFGELRDEPARLVLVARGWMRGHPLTHEIQAVYAVAADRLVLVRWREGDR